MELLLIQWHDAHVCVDMKDVSKVVSLTKEVVPPDLLLSERGNASLGIVFKNGRILPVDYMEKTAIIHEKKLPLNSFLKGCFTQSIIDGFVIADKHIYGVLNRDFLQLHNHNNREYYKEYTYGDY